jgi:hypothetical protein
MGALFANTRRISIGPDPLFQTIDEVRSAYASAMDHGDFTDIVTTPAEVAGNFITIGGQQGARLSVLVLPITASTFWRVAMVGGDTADLCQEALRRFLERLPVPTGGGDPLV